MVSAQSLRRSSVAIDPGIAFVRRRSTKSDKMRRSVFDTSTPVRDPILALARIFLPQQAGVVFRQAHQARMIATIVNLAMSFPLSTLHIVADLLRPILFVHDPFGRLLRCSRPQS